jgi:hypothetical protein
MLWALGSIIFLMSEHIANGIQKTSISNELSLYFYRPLFGALLAVASFIISISASGIISEQGDAKNINISSILALAFFSGLLSDVAYSYLYKRPGSLFAEEPSDPKKTNNGTEQSEQLGNIDSNTSENG